MLKYCSSDESFFFSTNWWYWCQCVVWDFSFYTPESARYTLNMILFQDKQKETERESRPWVVKALISLNSFRAKYQSAPVHAYRTTTLRYAMTPQRFNYRSKRLHEPEQRLSELDSVFCTFKRRRSWERRACLEVNTHKVRVSFLLILLWGTHFSIWMNALWTQFTQNCSVFFFLMLSHPEKKRSYMLQQHKSLQQRICSCMNHYRLGYFPIATSKNSLCNLEICWKVSLHFSFVVSFKGL